MRKRPFVTIAFAFAALSPFVALSAQEEWTATEANIDSRRGVLREEAVKGDFLLKVRTRHGDYDELNDVFRFQILLNQEFAAELKEEKEEWRSGCPQWISESERFRFAVESGAARTTGKSGEATPKNATETVKAKHGEIIREGDLVACRYILAIHAYGPGYKISDEEEPSKCGHVWISIYDLANNCRETTYGLWPYYGFWGAFAEESERKAREAHALKKNSCLLRNYEITMNDQPTISRYYLMSEEEYAMFMADLENQSNPALSIETNEDDPDNAYNYYCWTGDWSNCATYAGTTVNELTNETIDYRIFAFQHRPSAIADDLEEKEGQEKTSKENPLYDKTFYKGKSE